ncbi:hypothetical protein Hjap01_01586 [Haloarcula japonica]
MVLDSNNHISPERRYRSGPTERYFRPTCITEAANTSPCSAPDQLGHRDGMLPPAEDGRYTLALVTEQARDGDPLQF